MFPFRFFRFGRRRRRLSAVCHSALRTGPRTMEALDCPPEAVRRSRSRSPDATSHELPTTPAVVVAGCDETAITPTIDPHLDASCSACMAASRWIPHTCKKARGVNKRHATPAADGRRTKRSSVTAALGFRAPHHSETSVDVDSLSMTRSSMQDSSVRIVEGRDVPSHPSSSEAPPAPTRPPSPVLTPTLEQGEASEVDGDVEMAEPEDDIHAPSRRTAPLPSVNTVLARSGYSISWSWRMVRDWTAFPHHAARAPYQALNTLTQHTTLG